MSETNTGGPAFPGDMGRHQWEGMHLRDYFAAKAMQGILAGTHPITRGDNPLSTVARTAYLQADAMLKAKQA